MKKIRVAFLWSQMPGVVKYRMVNFADEMNRQKLCKCEYPKWDMNNVSFPTWEQTIMSDPKAQKQLYNLVDEVDVIVFHKFCNDAGIAVIRGIREGFPEKVVLFEIDDYMFDVPSWNMASPLFRPGGQLFNMGLDQLYHSSGVITSTNYLKDLYKEFNSKIFVIPNAMNLDWWGKPDNYNFHNKRIRIGWAGANAHKGDLELIEPVMERLLKEFDNIEFCFLGAQQTMPFKAKDRVIVDLGWTNFGGYPKKLKSLGFDIGLAPLRDNYFNRAKSYIKWLEYSMLQIPTVASNIGQFKEYIKEGETGFLATTQDDFYNKLKLLIENKELRKDVGMKAFTYVCENLTADKIAHTYATVLKQLIEEKKNGVHLQSISTGVENPIINRVEAVSK